MERSNRIGLFNGRRAELRLWLTAGLVASVTVMGCADKSATAPTPTEPDLVVSAASVSTAMVSIAAGGTIAYCVTVANTGAAVSGGTSVFDVAAYFSTDTVLDATDPLWAGGYSSWEYQLTAGFSREACVTAALGGTPPPAGSYYLIFKADAFPGQGPNFFPGVVESDENNNWRATTTPITIQP